MYTFVIALIIIFCVLLVLVILAQNAKGGGLTSGFGGSSASNIIGVKKTGDLLEKLTWTFIITIMALTLSTRFVSRSGPARDNVMEKAGQQATPVEQGGQDIPTGPADTTGAGNK